MTLNTSAFGFGQRARGLKGREPGFEQAARLRLAVNIHVVRQLAFLLSLCLVAVSCHRPGPAKPNLSPDHTVVAGSHYPPATDPARVGSYPALTKSGAGYFYDDVLEYRVWIHPESGGGDFYRAFASYEPALDFSKRTRGAEEPLVLVRQERWINEPQPGKFEPRSDERITEWRTVWLLENTKRTNGSIEEFLKAKETRPP